MFDFGTWANVVGLLATGAGGGYFTRQVVERHLNPDFAALKGKVVEIEALAATRGQQIQECQEERQRLRARLTKFEAVREALLSDEEELWRLHPAIPPAKYFERLANSKPRIVLIASNKGGVGKTTLTVNLAAYLEKRLNKRVLAIDLDYQGSLSLTLLRAVNLEYAGSLANDLIGGSLRGKDALQMAKSLQPKLPKTSVITANYEFYSLENRLMLRWLLEEIGTDIRFHLGSVLLSDEIQNNFDVVLLDAPPRVTTAMLNALCACHYLLVPTVPDRLSAPAVGRFIRQVRSLQGELNPALSLAGVVINLSRLNNLSDDEKDAVADIRRDLAILQAGNHVFERNIPRMVALSGAAGEDIAYSNDRLFREGIMDKLGDEIAVRIGLEVSQ